MLKRIAGVVMAGSLGAGALVGCGPSTDEPAEAMATVTVFETAGTTPSDISASSAPRSSKSDECQAPVIAIDPGHNPVETSEFDAETGVAMRDYSNGAEDADVMAVAEQVKSDLEKGGYSVVLLKKSTSEDVTYRQRVDRAEAAGADVGISIHTYTDDHRVFVQRVGLFREGIGADGQSVRVSYTNAETAQKSQKLGKTMAKARSEVEGRTVSVTDNSFNGRAPLWSGNIPMIALISEQVPWVYHEFGVPGGGGSAPVGEEGIATYAAGVTKGVEAALPNPCSK